MTWFEKIKACGTTKELAALLKNGKERTFCPHVHRICGMSPCRECIAAWLSEDEAVPDEKSAHPDGHPE